MPGREPGSSHWYRRARVVVVHASLRNTEPVVTMSAPQSTHVGHVSQQGNITFPARARDAAECRRDRSETDPTRDPLHLQRATTR